MDLLPKLISIFTLAFFSFWTAIPAGAALGVAPVLAGFTAWLSYSGGVVLVALLGEPLRERLMQRFGGQTTVNPDSPIRRAWDRFGLVGLSLLAPITTGSQIGVIVGLSLGVPPRKLILGMVGGAALWAVAITLAVMLGVAAVNAS